MFASLSQMIRETGNALTAPSSITQRLASPSQQPSSRPATDETDIASTASTTDHDDKPSEAEAEEKAERRRREKRSAILHETFIVVRPPPAMTNHPLNLQLQLVPPSTRDSRATPSTPQSSASTDTPEGSDMSRQRSSTMRSNRSNTSLYSSASFSTSSIASSSSSNSTRRIVPLYNLSAHNVMTNTVTDAGTDAKVAKFGKRGIEVIGLGVLECDEVIGIEMDPHTLAQLKNLSSDRPASPQGTLTPPETAPSSKAPSSITPSSSSSHLSESGTPTPAVPQAFHPPTTPTPNSAKRLFGKMFKRKDVVIPPTPVSPAPGPAVPTPSTPTPATPPASSSFFRSNKRSSATASSIDPPPPALSEAGALQAPCLGTSAILLYRTKSRTTVVSPSVLASLSGSGPLHGVALHKTQSKSSFVAEDRPGSREPTASGGHPGQLGIIGATEKITPEIHLDGVSPSVLSKPTYRRTSHSYEWVIRKWIKGADNGLFGIKDSLLSARSVVFAGLDVPGGEGVSEGQVEVRFEWIKGRSSKERARARERAARSEGGEVGPSETRTRRERPQSMINSHPEGTAVEGGPRAVSMYASDNGAPPVTPDKRSKRKSLSGSSASPGTYISTTTRSPSPGIRPSMESLRQNSDGSGDVPASSQDHGSNPGSTVYKGEKSKSRRRGSVVVRERAGDITDDESDPEDSETPWTCTLYVGPVQRPCVVQDKDRARNSISGSRSTGALLAGSSSNLDSGHRRIATSSSAQFPTTAGAGRTSFQAGHEKAATSEGFPAGGASSSKPQGIRLKLATMIPAPHHPKVVSHLKMPFPLPDVNITRTELAMGEDGSRERYHKGGDLILTMEEIKDVVCVTSLWLNVREGFGGLERRRKGDGWKIRG